MIYGYLEHEINAFFRKYRKLVQPKKQARRLEISDKLALGSSPTNLTSTAGCPGGSLVMEDKKKQAAKNLGLNTKATELEQVEKGEGSTNTQKPNGDKMGNEVVGSAISAATVTVEFPSLETAKHIPNSKGGRNAPHFRQPFVNLFKNNRNISNAEKLTFHENVIKGKLKLTKEDVTAGQKEWSATIIGVVTGNSLPFEVMKNCC